MTKGMSNDRLALTHDHVIQHLKQRDDDTLGYYLIDVTPLLEEYTQLIRTPKVIDFMAPAVETDGDSRIAEIRHIYHGILHKYNIDIPFDNNTPEVTDDCPECGSSRETILPNDSIICADCCIEKHESRNTFSYKDVTRINVTSKYNYNRTNHFRDCLYQFQGKQTTVIPQEVYDEIYYRINKYNLCRKDDVPRSVKYERVTKTHIYLFLKEMDYANYEDVNLIYHTITGKPLPDISHIEQDLIRDFEILNNLYKSEYIRSNRIKRKNFINTQYVLFQLLRRYGYPCDFDDFNVLKTIERKIFHDEVCSKLFETLEWNFTNVF